MDGEQFMSNLLYGSAAIYTIGFTFTLGLLYGDEAAFSEPRWQFIVAVALIWPIMFMWVLIYNILWKNI